MSIPGKVLIALLSSLVVAAVAAFLEPSYSFVGLLLPTTVAAVASVVLSHRALPVPEAIATDPSASPAPAGRAQAQGSANEARAGQRRGSGSGSRREEPRDRRREGKRDSKQKDRRATKRDPDGGNRREPHRDGAGTDSGAAVTDRAPRGEPEEGTVKWFNVTKGYGFIVRASGEEIFVHHRSVLGEGRGRLDDGIRVRFRVAQTDKGPQAEEVEPL